MTHAIANYKKEEIWDLLSEVKDPEIPVLSVVELGIVREITLLSDKILIRITPTYSGCPAMNTIEKEIKKKLQLNGISHFEINKDFSETWTTDWMPEEAKQKLKDYGIAPPGKTEKSGNFLDHFGKSKKIITCPYCNSQNTELQSEFGSTACKSQYYCHDCQEPFEHFKCI